MSSSQWWVSFVLAGCGASSAPASTPSPASRASASSTPAPVLARPLASPPVAAAPAPLPTFSVLFEGSCSKPQIGHVGAAPAFAFEQSVAWFDGETPRELFREKNAPLLYGLHGMMGKVGGVDAEHAWVLHLTPSRGEGYDGTLRFAAKRWKNQFLSEGQHDYWVDNPIEQPDGVIWAFANAVGYSEEASTDHFVAFSPSGDRVKAHLPGRDMAHAQRLASGELVQGSVSSKGKLMLRRWSPSRRVDDLVLTVSGGVAGIETQVGSQRAVVAFEPKAGSRALYSYDGEAFTPVELPLPVSAKDSWRLGQDDVLHVASGTEILHLPLRGEPTRSSAPAPGELAEDSAHIWWMTREGTLYGRGAKGWEPIALPDPPGASAEHGPIQLEYVRTAGQEIVVGTRRTEPGAGKKKKPSTVRTVYSSVSHGAPAHCGAPLRAGEIGRLPAP